MGLPVWNSAGDGGNGRIAGVGLPGRLAMRHIHWQFVGLYHGLARSGWRDTDSAVDHDCKLRRQLHAECGSDGGWLNSRRSAEIAAHHGRVAAQKWRGRLWFEGLDAAWRGARRSE